MIAQQRTLKNSMRCTGIGLHSGRKVYLALRPAPENTGIVFHRLDKQGALVPARADYVTDTRLCTTLTNPDGIQVSTVEHLMAAFAGLGIDNAYVDLDGPEVPIMDGSAAPFIFLIQCAGVVMQRKPRRWMRIKQPIEVIRNGNMARLEPASQFCVHFSIDFDHPLLNHQELELAITEGSFIKEVGRARTFGFLKEVEALRANGLAKGGSLDNAIVIGAFRILNEGGLRYEDEFVRHKMVDAIGDLALLGHPVLGRFQGVRAGHGLNNLLARQLLVETHAWEFVEWSQERPQTEPEHAMSMPHPAVPLLSPT
jgi:UDP-3-O-[3-hydroxymyristoyl] N-acetylglucosamine deacetylase